MKLSLKVVVSDFDGSYSVESETVGIPFVPAFSVSYVSVTLTQSERAAKVIVNTIATKAIESEWVYAAVCMYLWSVCVYVYVQYISANP